MSMTRGLAFLSRFSRKFFHDALPVALASVIAAMLAGQYNRPPAPPSIVVQAPPPPGRPAAQMLLDEYERFDAPLRRGAEAQEVAGLSQDNAPKAKQTAALGEERAVKARLGSSRTTSRKKRCTYW